MASTTFRALRTLARAAQWATTAAADLCAAGTARLRHRLRHRLPPGTDAVHITHGVHLLRVRGGHGAAHITVRAAPDNPVIITTAQELAAAVTAWLPRPAQHESPHTPAELPAPAQLLGPADHAAQPHD